MHVTIPFMFFLCGFQTWTGPVLFSEGLTVTGTTTFAKGLNIKVLGSPTDTDSLTQFATLAINLQVFYLDFYKEINYAYSYKTG